MSDKISNYYIYFPLINDFSQSLKVNSIQSYCSYLINVPEDSWDDKEKDFLSVTAIALAVGDKSYAIQLIDEVLNHKLQRNKATSLKAYQKYINGLSSKSLHNRVLTLCAGSNLQLYTQNNLKTIFQSRISTQSRLSGYKVWLPLYFLQLLCNHKGENLHITFKQEIYKRLKIIINCNNRLIHVPVSDIAVLGICNSRRVYCAVKDIVSHNIKIPAGIYQVYTPNGYLNHKNVMLADDIKDIVIDHVTPIDHTLKTLRLTYLSKISDIVKSVKFANKSLRGKDLESTAFLAYQASPTFAANKTFFDGLQSDLNKIIEDSHYRLMSSDCNANKSNVLDYKRFCKVGSTYYAIIDEDNVKDAIGNPILLYQDLNCDYMSASCKASSSAIINAPTIKSVDVPLDLL